MTRKLDQIERDMVRKVLRGELGRRDLFRVSALGATALAAGGGGMAASTHAARADTGGPNYKDMSKVMPIGGANATAAGSTSAAWSRRLSSSTSAITIPRPGQSMSLKLTQRTGN